MFDIEELFNKIFTDDRFSNKAITIKIIDGIIVFKGMGLTIIQDSLLKKYFDLFKLAIESYGFKVDYNRHNSEFNFLLQKTYFEINYSLIIPLSQRVTRPSMRTLLGITQ